MDKPIRILVLEDQVADAELLIREVKRAGFAPEWSRVETEKDFLCGLADKPDLILSDYNLPHFDGIKALMLLRQCKLDIPFILVSGTIGEEAAVEAMKLGADDYLLKDRTARLGQAIKHVLEEKRLLRESKTADAKIRAQLEELLRWQNVMVAREDRVQQLKVEVNELLAQLGQPPRYASPTKP